MSISFLGAVFCTACTLMFLMQRRKRRMSITPNMSFLHADTSARYQSPVTRTEPGGKPVACSVVTSAEDARLAERQEQPQGSGLLSRISAQIARPFVALQEWIGSLLGQRVGDKSADTASVQVQVPSQSPEDIMQVMGRKALEEAPGGLAKATQFAGLTAQQVSERHQEFATNNGPLRAVATALIAVQTHSQSESNRREAKELLRWNIEGIAFQQWATTGREASKFVSETPASQLGGVAKELDNLSKKISRLQQAVDRELKGELVHDQSVSTLVGSAPEITYATLEFPKPAERPFRGAESREESIYEEVRFQGGQAILGGGPIYQNLVELQREKTK
ncbi:MULTISPECIES: hypothetical protein [Pseudomonas]|uniref:hypothetical protein n=1 Tax=Pseudomonas TaxID=286 RepID=UPI000B34D940|nr:MULTISPECIES: hypothetical protein [Pseudomonas]PMY59512.1 type III secretion system effector GTPase-activating protein SptP [Pseudomonas sp. FW305-25]PMY60317.1 type III secretion system effector GTPase-activating protein SptP [Pseudomonas sp. FW126-L8]PNA69223.1 type III secretion system effector GTPase-activating protein SptP [Pseudomonas sp. FW305-76]